MESERSLSNPQPDGVDSGSARGGAVVPDGLIAILGDNTATQHPGSTSIAKGGIATRVVHALVHRLAMGAQMGGAASETPHHCLPY